MTPVEFVRLWIWWDEKPSDPTRANRMEDAVTELAAEIGMTATQVRMFLAGVRRRGGTRGDAVKLLLEN